MSTEINEEQQGELIRKAIEHADAAAGNDDVAFVRELRSKFFAEQSRLDGVQRRTSNQRRRQANNTYVSIYSDPRFARNARELTRLKYEDQRIIGGTSVQDTNFHDCVAVLSNCGGCTGTLIAKNAVLSAGHCHCRMEGASRVFVGNDVDDESGEAVNVARQVPHPEYQRGKHNDLMVLVLDSEITNVPPRKIASTEMIGKAGYARVVGFGNTDPDGNFGYGKKRQVNVPIVSNSCQGNTNGMDDEEAFNCDPGLELIAGKPMLAMDTCTGDSGGPLYISDGQDGWLLAGATSRATPGTPHNCGDGGVYVRVDRYLDWVQSIADVRLL